MLMNFLTTLWGILKNDRKDRTKLTKQTLPPRDKNLCFHTNNLDRSLAKIGSHVACFLGFASIRIPRYMKGTSMILQLRKIAAKDSKCPLIPNWGCQLAFWKLIFNPKANSKNLSIHFIHLTFSMVDCAKKTSVSSTNCNKEISTFFLSTKKPEKSYATEACLIRPARPSTTTREKMCN